MKNIVIVNGIGLAEYARHIVKDGKNSLQLVAECASDLPGAEKIILLTDSTARACEEFPHRVATENNQNSLIKTILKESKGYDCIFYVYADTPFLDIALSRKMYENHLQYFADYSFADGYPLGLSCEIISVKILPRLLPQATSRPIERDVFFEIIKKDINSFDIETEIAPHDLRMLRVKLTADCRRNFLLLTRIAQAVGSVAEIPVFLEQHPQVLRTLPVYFCIQIARDCLQECAYCPYPAQRKQEQSEFMALSQFRSILEKITAFCEDAVINISLWGEPALHPQLGEIIEAVMSHSKLQLVIETSGLGWQTAENQALLSRLQPHAPRIVWIVSLDGYDQQVYQRLRGEGYAEANATARTLLTLFPKTAYIQAVRMSENEDDLEKFYASWKEETENIIIQKYDHYCHQLPEKKVTDLSPVRRFPCWHLKRDVNILIDGSVPLCREDIKQTYPLGNILKDIKEDLEIIWKKGEFTYTEQLEGKYNTLCGKCDEYYTYNF